MTDSPRGERLVYELGEETMAEIASDLAQRRGHDANGAASASAPVEP